MEQNLFLDFKNVEIKQRNKIILNSVNLKIMKGEFVYFVGKTGSGKSSLLKAIYGDIGVRSGEILLKNQKLKYYILVLDGNIFWKLVKSLKEIIYILI